jgi:phosphoesterase RecJ-like protein
MTDTGCFRFSNTTERAMTFAGKLISIGLDPADIYQKCYESNSKNMVLFQSYCVNKAQFSANEKIAYTIVYKKDMEKYHHTEGEDYTDGLTEKLRAIKTTEIAFVVKELGANLSKVSMRSRTVNIAQVCSAFGGGGHKLAAGAVIKAGVEDAVNLLLNKIEEMKLC